MKCRLTNYPLSKNLVYVALQMHRSMYLDEEFNLDDDEHHSAIAEPNCFVRSESNWYPWLWSRVPQRTEETKSGWELYFSEFGEPHLGGDIVTDFFSCCNAVFQPRKELVEVEHLIRVACNYDHLTFITWEEITRKRKKKIEHELDEFFAKGRKKLNETWISYKLLTGVEIGKY